jgi:hypothetical protein
MSIAPTSRSELIARPWSYRAVATAWVAALVAVSASGCHPSECLTNTQFYEQKVWAQVVATNCLKCHAPEGVAASQNAKFLQVSSAYPGFLDLNTANITTVAKIQFDGKSELLLKPIGQMNHGGGPVLQEGSDEYKILADMVDRANNPVSCDGQTGSTIADQIPVLSPADTLRKATLQLSGRLPTDAELSTVGSGGEDALSSTLDGLMNEDAFYNRLKELYADVLLTGRYSGQGLGLLSSADYPSRYWFNPSGLPQNMLTPDQITQQTWSDYGISAEPLELIAYVARNNRPFSEILTADYTVVNPYSARVYGLDPAKLGFANLGSYYEFQKAKVSITRAGAQLAIPHAGILTTPVFLNRYPTTTTNVNRARARFTFKYFLATDLLAVAERPIDPSSVISTVPTRDDPNCTSCHKIIDPVASTYQKWDSGGSFQPTLAWPAVMPQPGFGTQTVPNVGQYPAALQWLATTLVQDPRFARSVFNNIYAGVMGQDPTPYPLSGDPDFAAKEKAWQEQNRIIQSILDSFNNGNQNVKLIFKGLIMSPLFRATNASGLTPIQSEAFGTGNLLTPEVLARKVPATLGIKWYRYDFQDYLTNDYDLLYGGIDFNNVIKRLTVPNGVMVSVGQRLATEMACSATAWDFSKKQVDRKLFTSVELSQTPEDDNGFAIPDSSQRIRKNIQSLHQRLLGETLDINDPEIERTFQLYVKTWRDLHAAGDGSLQYDCQGLWNRETGAALPNGTAVVTSDKYYTVRSWMAVLTYLLMDFKFLYQQ